MTALYKRSDFRNFHTVLIKAGTSVITHTDGTVALSRVSHIVEQIVRLVRNGVSVILVSSGSVGIGKQKLGHHLSPSFETNRVLSRSFAATGQPNLMAIYDYMFSYYNIKSAQILLTDDDFTHSQRIKNLNNVLNKLLSFNVVPILNENDVISLRQEHLRDRDSKILWDNDSLASLVASDLKMDLVILLTDVDGLYKHFSSARDSQPNKTLNSYEASDAVIDVFEPHMRDKNGFVLGQKSRVGRGGMKAKLNSALQAVQNGVKAVVIANGKRPDTIDRVVAGEHVGTLFTHFTDAPAPLRKDAIDPSHATNDTNTRNAAIGAKIASETKKSAELKNIEISENMAANMARRAREASRKLTQLDGTQRVQMLRNIAKALGQVQNEESLIKSNEEDLKLLKKDSNVAGKVAIQGKQGIDGMVSDVLQICDMEDPVDHVLYERELATGLRLKKVETSLGVLMVILDSLDAPQVLLRMIALAVKSGNALILMAGPHTLRTNAAICRIVSGAINDACCLPSHGTESETLGKDLVQFVGDREDLERFLTLGKNEIDLIIARNRGLTEFAANATNIPILSEGSGLCHVYVDAAASLKTAVRVIIDSKIDCFAAGSSVETLLIDSKLDPRAVAGLVDALVEHGVKIFVGPNIVAGIVRDDGGAQEKARFEVFKGFELCKSFSKEYGSLAVTVEFVHGVRRAVEHINKYGSGHTDCIVTENAENAAVFLKGVDGACVFHNASTRFHDGYMMGLGVDACISTSRTHARGPVGMKALLTTKFTVESAAEAGDVVSEFSEGKRKFLTQSMIGSKL